MKAILEFDLDELDDRMRHRQCIQSSDMWLVMEEFLGGHSPKSMRSLIRLNETITEEQEEMVEQLRSYLLELLDDYGVSLET